MTVRSVRVHKDVLVREVQSSRTLRQVLQPVAAKATRTAQQVARERLTMRTGRYVSSFKSSVERGRGNELARIATMNAAPYAGVIESGSKPHVIKPRRAKVLVFQADNGETVFARSVNHPGTAPERVIEVALKRLARGL